MINRIISTIGKHIVAGNALTSRNKAVGIDKPTPSRIIVSSVEVIQPRLGWVLLCTRRGCPPPGHFFGRLLAEKENGSVMYQQASPFGDKRQFVGIVPSP